MWEVVEYNLPSPKKIDFKNSKKNKELEMKDPKYLLNFCGSFIFVHSKGRFDNFSSQLNTIWIQGQFRGIRLKIVDCLNYYLPVNSSISATVWKINHHEVLNK